ncbi:MAG: hypothetical protein HZB23_11070 [Deltaproteobacteria bacterium]|nr:hypothetical protein [Deltaproteobacteria bacterium]
MTGARPIQAIFLLILFVFASACSVTAPWAKNTEAAKEAGSLIERLDDQNRAISDRRGVGRFRLENANGALSGRVAWLSAPPDRLRMELLSPFGQPVATIAGDGDQVAVKWAADGKILRGNADGSITAKVFGMRIPWRALASSLAFRVWIKPGRGILTHSPKDPDTRILSIPGGLFSRGQRLFFRPGEDFPQKAEYDTDGKGVIKVEFFGSPDGAESRLVFSGKNGETLTLWPERFITNQGVTDNPFLLAAPGEPVKSP